MSNAHENINGPDKGKLLYALDWLYDKAVGGISGISGCYKIADDYLRKYNNDPKIAARKMIKSQIMKCTTTGFLTNLGGILTLPIAVPANITTVWFVQLQMIAAIAVMAGLDPTHDEVKALCYACLAGSGSIDIVKQAGVKFANKGGKVLIEKIPAEAIKALNRKLGMRFITKWGEKGIINLGKLVPALGGAIGGAFDFASTRIIGNRAIKLFIDCQEF